MANLQNFPDEVRIAAQEKRLIVFLGAGFSCAVGLPKWESVKERMVDECALSQGEENLRQEWKNWGVYQCFDAILKKDRGTYDKVIQESLDISKANQDIFKKWLEIVSSWNPVAIITTNIDELIEKSNVYKNSDFCFPDSAFYPQQLRDRKIFFLHGMSKSGIWNFNDKKSIYGNDWFKIFLHNVFGSYCVLFIGSSLSKEDGWLEFADINNKASVDYFHYALLPSKENVRPTELKDYYKIKSLVYDNSANYDDFARTIYLWGEKKKNIYEKDIAEAGSQPEL